MWVGAGEFVDFDKGRAWNKLKWVHFGARL